MSTRRSDPTGRRRAAVALLVTCCLTACSADDPGAVRDEPERTAPERRQAQTRQEQPAAAPARDVVASLSRTLARRAEAVRRSDRRAFVAGLDRSDPAFIESQDTYLANLEQLPLAGFGYEVDRSSLVREGRGYWVTVDVSMQLRGFDTTAAVTRDRYLLTQQDGRFVVASVTDGAWEAEHDVDPQPWELGPIVVRTGTGVLGVFDPGSAPIAARLVADVESSLATVTAAVPYPWQRRVVVYALSDPAYLGGLDDLPGGDPLALDAVTVRVPAAPGAARTAGARVVLNPAMVSTPGPGVSRLIRHELTHVALGLGLENVPLWLDEGLAEYVSVRPLAPQDRAISGSALEAAEAGLHGLPDARAFRTDTETSYGVAWWACEYVAHTYDESTLWLLHDAMRRAEDPEVVLRELLQIDEEELARKAGELMLDTYRPEPAKPSRSPGKNRPPSPSPSGDAPSNSPSQDSSS